MVRVCGRLVPLLAVVLAATVGCTSDVQRATQTTEAKPPRTAKVSVSPPPTHGTATPRAQLAATKVWTYPPGIVLVAAEGGEGAHRRSHVLLSTNRGATFADVTPKGMRTTAALSVDDIAALDSSHIWVAAWNSDSTRSTVYRTTDGGSRWHASAAPGHDAAAGATDSISFEDASHGWLVQQMPTGPVSVLYRTNDAGQHWHKVVRRLPQVAPVVADPTTGLWQGGGSFSDGLTHSSDGGHTWARADLGPHHGRSMTYSRPAVFTDQVFAATSTLTKYGEVVRFYRTSDAGTSWTQQARVGPLSGEPTIAGVVRLAQVAFASPTTWWVIALDPRPTVYLTSDAGQHWTGHQIPRIPREGRAPFVQIASGGRRYAWATIIGRDTDQLMATSDGGRTWALVHLSRRLSAPTRTAPRGQKLLGFVLSRTKVAHGYRVTLAPARRRADGQFVAIRGRAPVTYLIPNSLVLDGGVTLVGAIEITLNEDRVTALVIVGG